MKRLEQYQKMFELDHVGEETFDDFRKRLCLTLK